MNFPIILAHGIARFDLLTHQFLKSIVQNPQAMDLVFDRLHYFNGIATYLRLHGFDAHHSNVSFASTQDVRARELAEEVQRILLETGADKCHIIAHSMGGLDARHMIVDFGMEKQIASLTTIGTPHAGTAFADHGLSYGGSQVIKALRGLIDLSGFQDLSTVACKKFNDRAEIMEAKNSVYYRTVSSAQTKENVLVLFRKSWQIIFEKEGENDGLVSVYSQKWVKGLKGGNGNIKAVIQLEFPMPGDHLNEVGWWTANPFGVLQTRDGLLLKKNEFEDAVKIFYLELVKGL